MYEREEVNEDGLSRAEEARAPLLSPFATARSNTHPQSRSHSPDRRVMRLGMEVSRVLWGRQRRHHQVARNQKQELLQLWSTSAKSQIPGLVIRLPHARPPYSDLTAHFVTGKNWRMGFILFEVL